MGDGSGRALTAMATGVRALRSVERMVRVADEGFTMNFAVSARVAGRLTTEEIRRGLDELRRVHPLLGAAIERDRLRLGGAAAIALVETALTDDSVDGLLEGELRHRRWDPDGPRARCLVARHPGGDTSLVLAFDHTTSDGSSGVLAMRDLLRAIAFPEAAPAPIDSPGQDRFYPKGRGGFTDFVDSLGYMGRQNEKPKPFRVRRGRDVAPDDRTVRIRRTRFSRDDSAELLRLARDAGATVHGLLVAALSCALVEDAGRTDATPVRVMHPVDMRRFLATLPGSKPIGDAIGYYVSSVETDHRVDPRGDLASLGAEVTATVRAAKERGEPFYTAPSGGRLLVLARSLLGRDRFRTVVERDILAGTFSITNLGPLEKLGLEPAIGHLRIGEVSFVASPSIFGVVCASASSFDGELEFVLHTVEPFIDAATAERLSDRISGRLRDLRRA